MIFEVVIPNLGATGSDVVIEDWLVKPGDYVQAGKPIYVVTTDKATVEVEAFRNGYVKELLVKPGIRVPLGTVVALITDSPDLQAEKIPVNNQIHSTSSLDVKQLEVPEKYIEEPFKKSGMRRILASPLARRMANEARIPLENIKGSGKQGQILQQDVQQAIVSQHLPESISPGDETRGRVRGVPVTGMRRTIAHRTQLSKSVIPHYYATISIDMSEAKAFLVECAAFAEKKGWAAPTITDLTIRAAALALGHTPQINASLQDDDILFYEDIHIGLVVGLPEGVLVPVIHHADRKNLYTLAMITSRLKENARRGALSSHDLIGSTFSISNLGMFGLDSFIAVINPPEAGILALGAVRQIPAVWNDQVVPRWLMTAVLSVDHRVVDGIVAARFMDEFKQLLEHPVVLTLTAPEETSE